MWRRRHGSPSWAVCVVLPDWCLGVGPNHGFQRTGRAARYEQSGVTGPQLKLAVRPDSMKLRDVTIKLVSPLVLGAGPLLDLLNEVADCERAKLEAQVDKLRRNENRQYEAEYYDVPVSTLQQLDEMGIPWRRLVAMGPA